MHNYILYWMSSGQFKWKWITKPQLSRLIVLMKINSLDNCLLLYPFALINFHWVKRRAKLHFFVLFGGCLFLCLRFKYESLTLTNTCLDLKDDWKLLDFVHQMDFSESCPTLVEMTCIGLLLGCVPRHYASFLTAHYLEKLYSVPLVIVLIVHLCSVFNFPTVFIQVSFSLYY